jgi:hypothetical protein
MVFWKPNGTIRNRTLCNVGENPVEEGRDIASMNPQRADVLQQSLTRFLESVDAEKPGDFGPKRKRNTVD